MRIRAHQSPSRASLTKQISPRSISTRTLIRQLIANLNLTAMMIIKLPHIKSSTESSLLRHLTRDGQNFTPPGWCKDHPYLALMSRRTVPSRAPYCTLISNCPSSFPFILSFLSLPRLSHAAFQALPSSCPSRCWPLSRSPHVLFKHRPTTISRVTGTAPAALKATRLTASPALIGLVPLPLARNGPPMDLVTVLIVRPLSSLHFLSLLSLCPLRPPPFSLCVHSILITIPLHATDSYDTSRIDPRTIHLGRPL